MKKIQLLPYAFQKVALTILALTVICVYLEFSGIILNYFKFKHSISSQAKSFILPGDYVHFTFILDQIIPLTIIISIFLLIICRQKIEDEWIKQKRLISYKIAFFSVPVFTFYCIKVNPDAIILSSLILPGLIQIVSFLFLVKVQPRFIKFFNEK